MPNCFIAMPITAPAADELYRGDADHFAHVLEVLFEPAVRQAGFEPVRPVAKGADLIHGELVRNLETADLVLCDISSLNPNVFFELGIRTALNRPVCLVRDSNTEIPFDTGVLNFHEYDQRLSAWALEEEITRLTDHLKATNERSEGQNKLWEAFGLTQRGTEAIKAGAEAPEGAAMAVLLEEFRNLRATLDDRAQARFSWSPVDKATRARWHEILSREAEPYGPGVADFADKAQEVAANDGVRLSLLDVDDDIVALEMRGRELSPRSRNLIASLARSYGIDVSFVSVGEAD